MIKLADTLAPMADFPAVEAKDVAFNDNKSLQEKYDNGELGGGTSSGEENKIDSISINGSPITPDENKNVDITVPDAYDDTALVQRISDIESDYAKSSDIPSLSGYATETWVNEQGFLTQHQDISGLQTKTDDKLATTSKEVVGAINEVKDMADLILDTEVCLDKTYSSSKIYSAIQDAIDSSKNFTLAEIGKMSGASYKVVTSTAEMTDGKIIYLLENGSTYDMYIVEEAGIVTKIGDTAIDLSSYLKTTDAESTYLKKTDATITYVAQTSFNNHITDTVAHLTQFEKNKLLTTDNITSTINNNSDNTQVPSAKATYDLANTKANTNHTHNTSDIEGLSIPTKVGELTNDAGYISEVINNLTSTDTDKPLSANQGKILNDTKLNKTDANKLNCVTIDNVSLKEYILTNFTETGKTYYLIAKTTCTDLPKASNFYITVETPGMYTYKVTAKELNDSNGKYVCTYRTISSSWTAWEKVCTTTVADVPETTVDLTGTDIRGSIKYMVKSGICYVSAWGVLSDTVKSAHILVKADVMPKPIISCGTVLVHGDSGLNGKLVGQLYIDYNKALSLHIYPDSVGDTGFGSFSYPVAES